jgi:hypothetical protein
MDLRQK